MVQPQETHRPPLRTAIESYVSVTGATYAAKAGDRLIGVNRAGTVTITLPSAQLRSGRTYTVKDESGAAASNNITVAIEGSETIDGSATDVIADNCGAKHYYSNGANWFEVPLLPAVAVAHSATTGQGTDDYHAEAHTSAHASGGSDAIKLDDLSAADDNTDLDFSTSAHGLVLKGTNVGDFLQDDGTLGAPTSSGAVTRDGGQTTEATTTSTSAVDLMSATSLTVAALSPFSLVYDARKTSGAAARTACALKVNATVVAEAASTADGGWQAGGSDQAETGMCWVKSGARLTDYNGGMLGMVKVNLAADGTHQNTHTNFGGLFDTADMLTVQITSLILRGITLHAGQTLGVDEMHVYEYATS
jgi:hypothetical protein